MVVSGASCCLSVEVSLSCSLVVFLSGCLLGVSGGLVASDACESFCFVSGVSGAVVSEVASGFCWSAVLDELLVLAGASCGLVVLLVVLSEAVFLGGLVLVVSFLDLVASAVSPCVSLCVLVDLSVCEGAGCLSIVGSGDGVVLVACVDSLVVSSLSGWLVVAVACLRLVVSVFLSV